MIETAWTIGLTLPAAISGWYVPPFVARRRQEHLLRQRCRSTRSLVLTYDDGPGPDLTPRLLDLLQARGVKATFFLAGFRAETHPHIVDLVAAAGHEIGCHSHEHLNAWYTWPWRGVRDIQAGYRTLAKWTPPDGPYRPPHGKMTPLTWAALRRRGAPVAWWTVSAGDVEDPLAQVERAATEAAQDGGGVVLLHDFDRGPERAEFVLRSTELLLDTAAERGWTICTLGELMNWRQKNAA